MAGSFATALLLSLLTAAQWATPSLSAAAAEPPSSIITTSDVDALRQLADILSPAHVTATCSRILTFGGNCECNYREPASGRDADIKFDMHMYGQRRVCIADGYLGSGSDRECRVLTIQSGRYNGDPQQMASQFSQFGCGKNGFKQMYAENPDAARRFPLRREAQALGSTHLDLLDVSVPTRDKDVLWDLLRPGAKVTAGQVALAVVLDERAIVQDSELELRTFSVSAAREYLKMLTRLEEIGYKMLSFKPHPRCVESVQKEHGICLPIVSNTVWIK